MPQLPKKASQEQDAAVTTETRRAFLKRMTGFGLGASASALLAACGANPPATSAPTAAGEPAAAATNAPVVAATDAPAMAATSEPAMAATSGPAAQLAPAELTYIYPIFGTNKDQQAVEAAVNQITKAKINTTVKLQALDYNAFEERAKLASASSEPFDLIFTAGWANNYYQNVAQGNFVPLDDLLKQNAPQTFAGIPEKYWDGARINGNIYGVINGLPGPAGWGVRVRKDLAEKYKLDLDSITTYAELEPFLKQIKDGEADVTPILSDDQFTGAVPHYETHGCDPIINTVGAVVRFDDPNLKVFMQIEQPEYKADVELARKWYDAGYYTADPLPRSEADAAVKAGQYGVILDQWRPGTATELKNKYGMEWVGKTLIPQLFVTTDNTVGTLNAISRTSKNPERAAMLLELMNTDQELYNILSNGVEGKNWVWVDQSKQVIGLPEGVTSENNGYAPGNAWVYGRGDNGYFSSNSPLSLEEQIASREEDLKRALDAKASLALGFSFNAETVATEIAQVSAVIKELSTPLGLGLSDPATALPEMIERVKLAGSDKIVAEMQSQIDEWKKTK